jgi:pyruvate kinase
MAKPVITATQMLVSMTGNPRPTRAEAADVANAVLDGADAVMLSEETAAGRYPQEAVTMMDRIVRSAEENLDSAKFESIPSYSDTPDALSRAGYFIAKNIGAAAIITPTWGGTTACRVSRYRPRKIILATTPNDATRYFLSFCWGVQPVSVPSSETLDEMIRVSLDAVRQGGYVESGQQVLITGGMPLHVSGTTNFIKVERIE